MSSYYITLYNGRNEEVGSLSTRPTEYDRAKRLALRCMDNRPTATRVVLYNMRTGGVVGEYVK